jgi:hypothetical protein
MESNKNDKLYQSLFKAYCEAHTDKSRASCQKDLNELWKDVIKKDGRVDEGAYEVELAKLKQQKAKNQKGTITSMFNKQRIKQASASASTAPNTTAAAAISSQTVEFPSASTAPSQETEPQTSASSGGLEEEEEVDLLHPKNPTPAQEKLCEEIQTIDKQLKTLQDLKQIDLGGDHMSKTKEKICQLTKMREEAQKKLKRTTDHQKAQQKYRQNQKEKVAKAIEKYPGLEPHLKKREAPGRPRLEVDQPDLLKDILEIATVGAACSDRRREDLFRSVKTLDDLQAAISDLGYKVSRSGLYLRLLPRNHTTIEGRKHVKTVPVKLIRPENNLRKGHPDRMFAAESYNSAKYLVEFLGPDAAVFVSQDDKASVHIGVTAAKRQSSMLMNMRYRVRLPDHDFPLGSRQLLTPSVIAECKINPATSKVSYSGVTFINVR